MPDGWQALIWETKESIASAGAGVETANVMDGR